MIPKVIHYCWFGRNPLPEHALKCISSWKKFFPDYEIIEWNEDNFDVNIIPYTQQAYSAKKYAFVSDYARIWILYHYGGVYFDTDVEVIKSMDEIIARGPFVGIEVEHSNGTNLSVNPGLGLGVVAHHHIYKEILDYYKNINFINNDGTYNQFAIVRITTKILFDNGMTNSNELQNVVGIWIYPKDYFNPFDDNTGSLNITDNTRSIHWYTKTWMKKQNRLRTWIVRRIHRCFGNDSLTWLNRLLGK